MFVLSFILLGCTKNEPEIGSFELQSAFAGALALNLSGSTTEDVPIDRTITLIFSEALNEATIATGITLSTNGQAVTTTASLSSQGKSVTLATSGLLLDNTVYTVDLNSQLKSSSGASTTATSFSFKTQAGELRLISLNINDQEISGSPRVQNVPTDLSIVFNFSTSVDLQTFNQAFTLPGVQFEVNTSNDNKTVKVSSRVNLDYIKKYKLTLSNKLASTEGRSFTGYSLEFYTKLDPTLKFAEISDEELLTKVQQQTFKYFWDFAHPVSGLARERKTSGNTVTVGGSGFGVMAIIVGIERGFITRQQGMDRLQTIVNFLKNADRFHGVWPHWMNGNTGAVIPFSSDDNGGDLVETAFMIEGLLTVREYLNAGVTQEDNIKNTITQLWEEVEWDWYTQGGQDILYWHWSPNFGWQKNHKIQGWNEALIVYTLAAASPTHSIDADVYHKGWSRNGAMMNNQEFYNINLPLGSSFGGPLFFAHYSFLGLDPRNLVDQYANYWTQNVNHSKINRAYCVANPKNYVGYSEGAWGLTASDNDNGYSAQSPSNDLGVITPTAALSSMPYTPDESIEAMRHFYYILGDKLWGEYGFYDAFNLTENWFASSYLAIDQGPIVIMIENHRTGLLWDLFMENNEISNGLNKLGFTSY
jgi:hypothetical protein